MKKYAVNNEGYYGEFGGCYVPEELQENIRNLKENYLRIIESEDFQKEYRQLLRDYAGRPTPLYLSPSLCEANGCRVYLKREDLNHTGAHKINNAIGQILIAKRLGKNRIIAETGAGQHGVATATVCTAAGVKCTIFMGEVDVARQRLNVEKMKMLGAEIRIARSGSGTLTDATNEALMEWSMNPNDTYYLIGSAVGPHPYPDIVARLQAIISEEIKTQIMEKEGREAPDYLVACVGGGSNATGTIYNFLDNEDAKIILAEAGGKGIETGHTAATLSAGTDGVLHGAKSLLLQDEMGRVQEPYSISAGLDYPGVGPLLAHLVKRGRAQVVAINDDEALEAGYQLTRNVGILPAIESSHALAALGKVKFKEDDVVVVTVSGRGDKDLETYLKYVEKR